MSVPFGHPARPKPQPKTGTQFTDEMVNGLKEHIRGYSEHFRVRGDDHSDVAEHYVLGLIQADKRNMERMIEVVPNSEYQPTQHFLSHSPWQHRGLMDHAAIDLSRRFGGPAGVALLLDESACGKKGDDSVGVARQWDGRRGKEDNCQVGVHAALSKAGRVALIDARLYLPKEWTDDPVRCALAGVPVRDRTHRTKIQIAVEMVTHARELGLQFEWVGADAGYGHSLEFLEKLQAMGEMFLADIHSNRHIYLRDPKPYLPPQGRGRKRIKYHSDAKAIEVAQWAKEQPASRWKKVSVRETTKGNLSIEVLHERVWLWDKESATAHRWHLIVRREVCSRETIKYSLSNAPEVTGVKKLAQMQAQRFWIERAFEDAKSHVGMAQYQARRWESWHHHMALVVATALFMVEMRMDSVDMYPLLSCYDIRLLLMHVLPNRRSDVEELIRQMEYRHQQRKLSMSESHMLELITH
jgi:SRSO17 transposase